MDQDSIIQVEDLIITQSITSMEVALVGDITTGGTTIGVITVGATIIGATTAGVIMFG
jgi:hypothetical protein